jgi:hypothetical protein
LAEFGGTILVQRNPDFVMVASAMAAEVPSGTKVLTCSTAAFGSTESGVFVEQPNVATAKRTNPTNIESLFMDFCLTFQLSHAA